MLEERNSLVKADTFKDGGTKYMENSMFCFQCQETFKNTGCVKAGVCGKNADVAHAQDVLVYATKKLAQAATQKEDARVNKLVVENLFATITNANFDEEDINKRIADTKALYEELSGETFTEDPAFVGVLSEKDEDKRSLKELITYGLKGLSAYSYHAHVLGKDDESVDAFMVSCLAQLLEDKSVDDLVALTLETGKYGVKGMALLDAANTGTYGAMEATEVNIGVRNNPGILISGHDLKDLELLLEATKGTGVDVYTHSEMLAGNYYPFFKKYDNFVGNYGNAWWKQRDEFESFNGPILMTTNCIVPPKATYKDRLWTTGVTAYPGAHHIDENKDFTAIIEQAKTCQPPKEIESGTIVGGFAHDQVFALADKIVDAVKSGAIKKFFVMAGCDGRSLARSYYSDFAKGLPEDTVILTAGCAKYRYNKLGLGDINGIPRVLDAGQCNDSYSLVLTALKLQEIFGLESVNDLPLVFNIAWYEQKAVIVLLALLSLGVKNIHLGPTLPAFLSPNVTKVLVDNFNIGSITTAEDDLKSFLG